MMSTLLEMIVAPYDKQVSRLVGDALACQPDALARIRCFHPDGWTPANPRERHRAASLVIARENGFASRIDFERYLVFRHAVAEIDAGNVEGLREIVSTFKWLAVYHCRVGKLYERGYFAGASLMRHVAGNPDRGPLPPNIVEIARAIMEYHHNVEEIAETIGLLLTSRRASEAGVALRLIEMVDVTESFDPSKPGLLDAPLLNMAPQTARELIARGAIVELRHSAALGDVADVGRLLATSSGSEARNEAAIYACIAGQPETLKVLVQHGATGDVLIGPGGATPRTALHEAANRGYAEMVLALLAAGASVTVRDARWAGTAADWAREGRHPDLENILRERERQVRE